MFGEGREKMQCFMHVHVCMRLGRVVRFKAAEEGQ